MNDDEQTVKIAKWLDNSSVVANRITAGNMNNSEEFFDDDDAVLMQDNEMI
jgi:hypothetical protein